MISSFNKKKCYSYISRIYHTHTKLITKTFNTDRIKESETVEKSNKYFELTHFVLFIGVIGNSMWNGTAVNESQKFRVSESAIQLHGYIEFNHARCK